MDEGGTQTFITKKTPYYLKNWRSTPGYSHAHRFVDWRSPDLAWAIAGWLLSVSGWGLLGEAAVKRDAKSCGKGHRCIILVQGESENKRIQSTLPGFYRLLSISFYPVENI